MSVFRKRRQCAAVDSQALQVLSVPDPVVEPDTPGALHGSFYQCYADNVKVHIRQTPVFLKA